MFGGLAEFFFGAGKAQEIDHARVDLDVEVGALDVVVGEEAHADLLRDPRIIHVAAEIPVFDLEFVGDFIDRADLPGDALGFLAVGVGGHATRQKDEAIDHGDIDFAETGETAGSEEARLDLGGGGSVVGRLEEGAVGETAAQERRSEEDAGEKARSHRVSSGSRPDLSPRASRTMRRFSGGLQLWGSGVNGA